MLIYCTHWIPEIGYATFVTTKSAKEAVQLHRRANLSANMETRNFASVCVFLILLNSATYLALQFHLPAGQQKCLKEEIHKDVLVTGEYLITEVPDQKASLKVDFNILTHSKNFYEKCMVFIVENLLRKLANNTMHLGIF